MIYLKSISAIFTLMHVICIVVITKSMKVSCQDYRTVTISSGKIKGTVLESSSGRQYHAFRGIPYGKPPVDTVRFKPPEPVDQWDGVRDVTDDHTQCPQFNFMVRGVDGKEDCLVINVYTPHLNSSNGSLPVLVFIHGGAFVLGSGTYMFYGASRFMDQDVVLVTFNYRLGVLGFLSTGDKHSPGNYGLLDQILALQWVQKNIEHFGGDRNKVTLLGESAGAVSAMHLMLSPLAKGLFHAVICESGSSLNYWSIQKNPMMFAKWLAAKVNCDVKNIEKMLECLRQTPYRDLVISANEYQRGHLMFPIFLMPVVDKTGSPNALLTETPEILLAEGRIANKVPLIIGINKDEGYPFYKDFIRNFRTLGKDYFNNYFVEILAPMVDSTPQQTRKLMPYIQKEYFANDDDLDDPDLFERGLISVCVISRILILSDAMIISGVSRSIQMMADVGVPTYAYLYSYIGHHCFAEILGGIPGKYCGHADDLLIMFDFFFAQVSSVSSDDRTMASKLNTLWVNFAKTKKPFLENQNLNWSRYNTMNPVHVELNFNLTLRNGVLGKHNKFWLEKIPKLIRKHKVKSNN